MAIACPYCKHSFTLKTVKPGKYAPKCPKCARGFRLLVPDDPAQAALVRALDAAAAEGAGATTAPDSAAAPSEQSATAFGETASELPPAKPAKEAGPKEVLATLGGYQVLKLLGRGGMGAVYLARQTSLDRLVAVKVMLPKAAANPGFVARFTREAYAAAQMVHHNVVQIYDIGSANNTHYFSMEYVKGESLMDVVRREGKLDPEQAVGYILQAARGLKYGHDMGMIHRDVKPDNLMINDQGIVKVADLGLVKLADEPPPQPSPAAAGGQGGEAAALARQASRPDLTRAGFAMGTPSFMAPEQAANSSTVGPAADVYSLGCTLYVLLTGKPPFEGQTVMEVLTKHAAAPVVRPDAIVKRVPKALADILMKMLAKTPEERYPNMRAVIEALENYLGVSRAGPFTPREEHADALEKSVRQFNAAPTAKLRSRIVFGFVGVVAAFALLSALFGWTTLAGGFLGLGILTPIFYFLIHGFARKTPLFLKVRELTLSSGPRDWIVWGVSALLFLVLLWLFGLLGTWVLFSVLALGAALAVHFGLDRRIEAERAPAVAKAEKLFKNMRLQGLEEAALRQFACKYSGSRWEEFFETLFGYEAKLTAREWSHGEMGKAREKFGAWREPIIAWIDARQQARKATRERKHLQAVEVKALQAEGMNAVEAEAKAGQIAEEMVHQAAAIKAAGALPVATAVPVDGATAEFTAPPPPANLKQMLETARKPETLFTLKPRKKAGPGFIGPFLAELVGPRLRFLIGAVLLAGFLGWLYENDLLALDKLLKQTSALTPFSTTAPKTLAPFGLPLASLEITKLFGTVYAGAAGLILVISGLFVSRRMTFAVAPGAAAVFVAPWVPEWYGLPSLAFLVGGLALVLLGFLFLRKVRYSGPRAYDDE
jgi:serine/threonine protein kinase